MTDLRQAEANTFERHIKKLSRLLHSPDLDGTTRKLAEGIDLDAWEQQCGRAKLEWPSEIEKELGIVVSLIDRFSETPSRAFIFSRTFYRNGTNNISSTLRNMTGQMIVPFARDYIDYVHRNTRTAAEGTITEGTTADEPIPATALIEIREALEAIKTRLPDISVSNAVKSEIYADISHIEIEAERPTPRPLLMKLYLESLRDNLAKAAGAGTAAALVAAVGGILAKYFGLF